MICNVNHFLYSQGVTVMTKNSMMLTPLIFYIFVPGMGLEPIRPQRPQDFKSCVSTIPPPGRRQSITSWILTSSVIRTRITLAVLLLLTQALDIDLLRHSDQNLWADKCKRTKPDPKCTRSKEFRPMFVKNSL